MADDTEPVKGSTNSRRDAMWAQGVRLLGIMNGGAAVALLAFVQAIWKDAPELVGWIAASLFIFSLGLVFATLIPLLRAETILRWSTDDRDRFFNLYRRMAKFSIGMFVLGIVIVAVGILNNLP